MSTYTAWDGNDYPLPTPAGWYRATDDRWWPEGHGPGPATSPEGDLPFAAPPSDAPAWDQELDRTIYSSPSPGSGDLSGLEPQIDQGGGAKKVVLVVVALLGLVAVGVGAFLALGSDDGEETAPATTVFQTEQPDAADAPETTAAPEAETVDTTVAPQGKGSLGDPFTINEPIAVEYTDVATGEVQRWEIVVLAPASDITAAVLEENQFNDPPEGDQLFVAAPISVTFVSGAAPASLFDLTFKAVGPSGVVLTTFDPSCGVIPEALDVFAELFPGGTVEGSICWPASPADAEDLTMLIEVFLEDTEIYVDLGG